MAKFDLRPVVRDVEASLVAQGRASGVGHRGSMGSSREWLIADLLRRRLPQSVEVFHSAEIVTQFNRSGQIDVVIADASIPPLVDYEAHRVIAGESVVGVLEVKSTLDRPGLEKAYDQLHAAKGASGPRDGGPVAAWIVAFRAGDLRPLRDALAKRHATHPGGRDWIDGVWVPGKGGIAWVDSTQRPLPRPAGGAELRAIRSTDTLFLMLWLMTERLREFAPRAIDMLHYADVAAAPPMWEFQD